MMSFLDLADLSNVTKSCGFLSRMVDDAVSMYWVKNELVCYHSKASFEEDTLGVGLSLEHYAESGKVLPRLAGDSDTSMLSRSSRTFTRIST